MWSHTTAINKAGVTPMAGKRVWQGGGGRGGRVAAIMAQPAAARPTCCAAGLRNIRRAWLISRTAPTQRAPRLGPTTRYRNAPAFSVATRDGHGGAGPSHQCQTTPQSCWAPRPDVARLGCWPPSGRLSLNPLNNTNLLPQNLVPSRRGGHGLGSSRPGPRTPPQWGLLSD